LKEQKQEIRLAGIPASPGIAIGTALVLGSRITDIEKNQIRQENVESEINILEQAIDITKKQVLELQEKIAKELKDNEARIFDAHLLILDDYTLINSVKEAIKNNLVSADYAFYDKIQYYVNTISKMKDPYLKERGADIRDVASRVIANMYGKEFEELKKLPGQRIIISVELNPSDTILMDRENAQAFATETGSRTSHAAIIARSMNIPAVVAITPSISQIRSGDIVIIDGYQGIVIVNPSVDSLNFYTRKETIGEKINEDLMGEINLRPETIDGYRIQLMANIEVLEDMKEIEKNKVAGIGLYRTEYLYINSEYLPNEDLQYKTYAAVVSEMKGKPVTIRTLDLGGDKIKTNISLYLEKNPFLGYRAIRLCLGNLQLFKTQLKAILRASVHGNMKIMFPMISCVEEVDKSLYALEEVKKELHSKNIPFSKSMEIGIMIETPSAAILADKLAAKVDFFSIGTNDLIQYTLAVDRTSEKVAYLYQPTHPSILTLIKYVVDAARKHGIWVSVCGEMAGDPQYTILLMGLGISELSMSPVSINLIRKIIRNSRMYETEEIVEKALNCSTANEALTYSLNYLKKIVPDIYDLIIKGE